MDYLYYIFGALIFLSVLLLITGACFSWNASKSPAAGRLARRLRALTTSDDSKAVSITKQRLLSKHSGLQRLLLQVPRIDALDRLLLQSGRRWNVAQFCGIALLAACAGLLLGGAFGLPLLFRLALAGAAAALPLFDIVRAKAGRLARIEQQLPDALDLVGRAMRAGHAFPTALKMIGDEMKEPLAGEFRSIFEEVNYGVAMSDALMNLASRVPSTDLRYFVVAVLIQRETGGNLSELLTSISAIIRDRIKLLGQIRVLSAEGRMSAWILSLLPFGTGLMMQLTSPEMLSLLYTDPGGRKMLAGAGVLMLIGVFVIRKITHIRV